MIAKDKIKKKLFKLTIFLFLQIRYLFPYARKMYVILGRGNKDEFLNRIKHFIPFYVGEIIYVRKFNFKHILNDDLLVVLDSSNEYVDSLYYRVYNLDYEGNHQDAWEWFEIASKLKKDEIDKNIKIGRIIFKQKVLDFKKNYSRTFIFGTGPSLSKADELSWIEGLRIVSNTIVKDAKLWEYINPHVIVAGDALYHFGHTDFAICFRNDLKKRLQNSDALFVYPAMFDSLVSVEFKDFKEKLIPIPYFNGSNPIINLDKKYFLPRLGNVLNQLLLPLASTLSNEIYLWGFDGRAPNDKLFWQNSNDHFYEEHVEKLKFAHPAFFKHNVPNENPSNYVNKVHGDKLNMDLNRAERNGYKFFMIHKSWTKTLNARYVDPKNIGFLKK